MISGFVSVLLALSIGGGFNAFAESYILCHRDAEITAVNPEFDIEADPCAGEVALQGISYECGKPEDYHSKIDEFLSNLKENGESYCQSYCAKRSRDGIKCKGVFSAPEKCGYTVPAKEAEKFGKTKAPCNPACKGQAFIYCSIYHGSFLRVEPEFLKGVRANCLCRRAK